MKTFKQYIIEELSASEALYGMFGWLTTRKTPISLGAAHECGEPVTLIDKYIKTQKLKQPRNGWDKKLIPMSEEVEQLDKSVVLYFSAKEIGNAAGACCMVCRHFIPKPGEINESENQCTEVIGDINGSKGICGLYAFGKHKGPMKKADITKESSSYSEQGPTHCGNCFYWGSGESKIGKCARVKGELEYNGCCNAHKRKT